MTAIFLKAKHWQLFLLAFGVPLIIEFIMMGTMFANFARNQYPDPTFMIGYMKYFSILMFLFMGVMFGWFWSVVVGLQNKIPEGAKTNSTRFRIFFFIPLIYILFFATYMSSVISGMMNGMNEPDTAFLGSFMIIIFPLHLFSMFCIFHTFYYVAKTFRTAELQRKVSFSDFAGEFFLVWFFPIGVWIIQPKINKMVEKESSVADSQ